MPEITTALPLLALTALAAYLVGAIPFGMVFAKLFGLGDLRQVGSGNIGATNVLRTGNKPAAALTLLFDVGKGGVAVVVARALFAEDAGQLAGFAAFLGHCFPVYLKFKGGKGVATWLGTLLGLAWPVFLAAGATWLVTAGLFRISSLAALVAALLTPLWAYLLGFPAMVVLLVALAVLIYFRHSGNIRRILAGTESKIGKKS